MNHPICKVIVLALATFILALLMDTCWNKKAADICGNLGEVPDSQSLAHLLLGYDVGEDILRPRELSKGLNGKTASPRFSLCQDLLFVFFL